MDRRQAIMARARAEVGTKEMPPNSNKVKYNTWFYNKEVSGSAYPWCCAFIAWLFRDAKDIFPKTASCAFALDFFESRNEIVTEPKPGDIVFFKYKTNNRKTNHIGLVMDVKKDTIVTIEGNTSQKSSDNGGCVMRRERSKKSNVVAFARPRY